MCGCRKQNNQTGVSAMTLSAQSSEEVLMSEVTYEQVTFASTVKMPQRIYIRALDNRVLRNFNVPHLKQRYYTIASHQQEVPTMLVEWMQGDGRYKNWIADVQSIAAEEPEPVTDPEPIKVEEPVAEAQVIEDSAFVWAREDFETSTKAALLAYADYHQIDLGEATLKEDIKVALLEWYDANNSGD